jgi:putative glycosyltransferase (TIGR04372 family)
MLNLFNTKILSFIKKKLKKKIQGHKYQNLFFRAIIHFFLYILSSNFRKNKCFVDPSSEIFYKYKKYSNLFTFPLSTFAYYLKKKKILISVNNGNNYSMGHIYSEISDLKKMQKIDKKYIGSTIWFTTSRKEILGDTRDIFEDKDFIILFGGIKRIFLTFVAIKCPEVSIDASEGRDNYIISDKKHSYKITYHDKPKKRANLRSKNPKFYPYIQKLANYHHHKLELMKKLNISKKYIVIQIKTKKINGTIKPLNPFSLLKTIRYFQNKNYQIVFAGREKLPESFHNQSIIDYANSRYASSLNDFILVGHCSFVLCSASGFSILPEVLDKPLLIINTIHGIQYFGRRTLIMPTLLSRKSEKFNVSIQHKYLCIYGADCGYDTYDDLYIFHMPTSDEIFMAAKELESMIDENIPPFSLLQLEIYKSGKCPLLSHGLSRIPNYYLSKHKNFFN